MKDFEQLRQTAADKGIDVIDWDFESDRIQGLYCDGIIALSKKLPNSTAAACVLEEEIAHHDLTAGNIIYMESAQNRRQERKARMLAAHRRADLHMIAAALRRGLRSQEEIADYLGVTEEFLCMAIEGYRQKYGQYVRVGDDILLLEPTVGLLSMRDDF